MNKLVMTFALLLAGLCACTSPERSDFQSLPSDGWAYGDTIRFFAQGVDTIPADGALALAVRHTNGYPYSNLWLEITIPQADTTLVDTVDIRLADPFGQWYGKGIGVSYQRVDTVYPRINIKPCAPVTLRHIMRVDTLAEIEQIGLIFTPESVPGK